MKAISLWQPWAWAIFHGKPVENRDWYSGYRGPLLIHASKRFDQDDAMWIMGNKEELGLSGILTVETFLSLPRGYLVGMVKMVGCVRQHPSPWFFGPYGHVYENPMEFKTPILYRGMPGIFDVPDEAINP